ncbi:hypothetical protein CS053_17280 [Rhodanobacter glycinis]|uniref:DUF1453 domain-containing protein n=1 Tax=Rhodanobacter glycinis TaxID=582702 RepID=A0A5B9E5Y5_9GAMM|nr:hypothetical protein [Rhodanobacter glycinis]QEE26060.1 hypothetical protein CS053_17280 [Rhodanobacter glycinis]
MSRLTQKQYQRHAMLAGAAYIAAMLLVWPLARTAVGLPLKVVLAMLPLLPMFYLIGLLAWRIRDSDELEQRMHLVALGVTGAVVAASSMVGGFLAAAKIVPLDGSILIMVFPLMASCYGVTRWWVARRYGVSVTCDDAGSVPVYLRFLLMALVMGLVALFAHYRQNDEGMGTALGVAAVFAVAGVVFGVRRWLSSRQGAPDDQ